MSCIGWVQAGEVWALCVPLFHVCPKSACCSCVCRSWPAHFAVRFWLFSGFSFLYGLPYLGARPCLTVDFAFLQPTIFPATISCHTTLSFLLRNCFPQSCWAPLGMLFILLPMAQYDHLFFITSLAGTCAPFVFPWVSQPICFHWAYKASVRRKWQAQQKKCEEQERSAFKASVLDRCKR